MLYGKVYTYCWECLDNTYHEIVINDDLSLSSSCMKCDNIVTTESIALEIKRNDELHCPKCDMSTIQIQFLSNLNYLHWFCCTCGRDFANKELIKNVKQIRF